MRKGKVVPHPRCSLRVEGCSSATSDTRVALAIGPPSRSVVDTAICPWQSHDVDFAMAAPSGRASIERTVSLIIGPRLDRLAGSYAGQALVVNAGTPRGRSLDPADRSRRSQWRAKVAAGSRSKHRATRTSNIHARTLRLRASAVIGPLAPRRCRLGFRAQIMV